MALTFSSFEVQFIPFAQQIEREADLSDGIVIVSRENTNVIRAARAVMRRENWLFALQPTSRAHAGMDLSGVTSVAQVERQRGWWGSDPNRR